VTGSLLVPGFEYRGQCPSCPRPYHLTDYVNGRDLGVVQGPTAKVPARFDQSLLIEARPDGGGAPAAQN